MAAILKILNNKFCLAGIFWDFLLGCSGDVWATFLKKISFLHFLDRQEGGLFQSVLISLDLQKSIHSTINIFDIHLYYSYTNNFYLNKKVVPTSEICGRSLGDQIHCHAFMSSLLIAVITTVAKISSICSICSIFSSPFNSNLKRWAIAIEVRRRRHRRRR